MSEQNWCLEVFYDGDCPLCRREIRLLQRFNHAERVRFTDISMPAFDASCIGLSLDTLMARIHARLPDGSLLTGMEVFRHTYAALGFRTAAWLMGLPVIRTVLDGLYHLFARNRLRLTGRCRGDRCAARVH